MNNIYSFNPLNTHCSSMLRKQQATTVENKTNSLSNRISPQLKNRSDENSNNLIKLNKLMLGAESSIEFINLDNECETLETKFISEHDLNHNSTNINNLILLSSHKNGKKHFIGPSRILEKIQDKTIRLRDKNQQEIDISDAVFITVSDEQMVSLTAAVKAHLLFLEKMEKEQRQKDNEKLNGFFQSQTQHLASAKVSSKDLKKHQFEIINISSSDGDVKKQMFIISTATNYIFIEGIKETRNKEKKAKAKKINAEIIKVEELNIKLKTKEFSEKLEKILVGTNNVWVKVKKLLGLIPPVPKYRTTT